MNIFEIRIGHKYMYKVLCLAISINIIANIHIWGWHRVVISQKLKVFETKRYYICKARQIPVSEAYPADPNQPKILDYV